MRAWSSSSRVMAIGNLRAWAALVLAVTLVSCSRSRPKPPSSATPAATPPEQATPAEAAPPPPPPPPPPPKVGEPSPTRARPEPPYVPYPVFYATDRQRGTDAGYGVTYTRERATGDDLQYGQAIVSIPRDHRLGRLEAPSWLHFEFSQDPGKHIVLLRSEAVDEQSFYAGLERAAAQKEAFVFVHGYNVTFEDALRRTAQLAYDLKVDGAAVAYTWPSQDSVSRYLIAEGNVDWCKPHLARFLSGLAARSGARRIHVVAHSLGNRVLAHAIDDIVTAQPTLRPLFHHLVMAAADIDVQEFRQLAAKMKQSTDTLTLYVSSSDKALMASKDLARYARVGQGGSDVFLVSGIETVDATDVDNGFFWSIDHSYFGDSTSVLGDLWELLSCNWAVAERDALRAVGRADPRLWVLLRSGPRRTTCSAQ